MHRHPSVVLDKIFIYSFSLENKEKEKATNGNEMQTLKNSMRTAPRAKIK